MTSWAVAPRDQQRAAGHFIQMASFHARSNTTIRHTREVEQWNKDPSLKLKPAPD